MNDTPPNTPPRVRIVRPPNMPVIYVEGIGQMMVGFPNSRLMLSQLTHQNGHDGVQEDVHHVACELVVPTSALIEMAQGILGNLGDNKELLKNAGGDWVQKVIDVLGTLPATQATPQPDA